MEFFFKEARKNRFVPIVYNGSRWFLNSVLLFSSSSSSFFVSGILLISWQWLTKFDVVNEIKIVYENYTFVSIESINISYSRCGNFVEKIIQREGSKKKLISRNVWLRWWTKKGKKGEREGEKNRGKKESKRFCKTPSSHEREWQLDWHCLSWSQADPMEINDGV